jgi:hypothetical protein
MMILKQSSMTGDAVSDALVSAVVAGAVTYDRLRFEQDAGTKLHRTVTPEIPPQRTGWK